MKTRLKKNNIQKPKIEIYTRPGCGYCFRIISFLDSHNVKYTNFRLGEDFTRQKFETKFGKGATFPRVLINNQLVGGCDETINLLSI